MKSKTSWNLRIRYPKKKVEPVYAKSLDDPLDFKDKLKKLKRPKSID